MKRQTLIYFFIFLFFSASILSLNARNTRNTKKNNMWDYSRISLSGSWLATQGDLKDDLPYGYGYSFAYDQGLDKITGSRYSWMPGFRFELGSLCFSKGESEISGMNMNVGPLWLIYPFNRKYGNLSIAVLPGSSVLAVKNGEISASATVFTLNSLLIYEYHYNNNSFLYAGLKYQYLDNETTPLTAIGIIAGAGYKI